MPRMPLSETVKPSFLPPLPLRSGLAMTLFNAFVANDRWLKTAMHHEPTYISQVMTGADGVPIHTWRSPIPAQGKGTLIATYGITGTLENQGFLRQWGRWAHDRGYGVLLFDWRAHGKTAELSPTLTSDGLYEGEDFVHLAAQAKALGYPAPFWFSGYSLGGQLALWGIYKGQQGDHWGEVKGLTPADIGGGIAICPSLESERSLKYLVSHPLGQYVEKAITKNLKKLAWELHEFHPGEFDPVAIEQANSIWGFDEALVIERLGFASVEDYYAASSALPLLPQLNKPTFLLYAADDPLFDPTLVPELQELAKRLSPSHPLKIHLTRFGGHVGYIANRACQRYYQDGDELWAIHRSLDWLDRQSARHHSPTPFSLSVGGAV
ncbi:MAG: alpha/beta fold hydrolase [Synechocystis sp.]|nr:alpha/beta fold hydrolase [Synechocystis sp.]